MDIKLLSIEETDLSVRSKNALHRVGVSTIGDMMEYDADKLSLIRNLGAKSITEILEKIEYYKNYKDSNSHSITDVDESQLIIDYLSLNDVKTETLTLISARAYNQLIFNGYDKLEKFIFMTVDDLMLIEGMDKNSAIEIFRECKYYINENKDKIKEFSDKRKKEEDISHLSVFEVPYADFRDKVAYYVKVNDIEISDMLLSARPKNRLIACGYRSMSDIVFMSKNDIKLLGHLGENSVSEIFDVINQYRSIHENRIKLYVNGETSALIDNNTIENKILKIYHALEFRGLTLDELSKQLNQSVEISTERIKKVIGKLLANKTLEYVDYRCYKVYPRFVDYYLKSDIDTREKEMIASRLSGLTLDEIGTNFSITRERVRQVLKRSVEKIKEQYVLETGDNIFDEDYYKYLYETYDFDHDESSPWLGVPAETWRYLDTAGSKKGALSLESALKDTDNLEAALRLRIKNYINRNKIYIDGKWVEKTRAELEPIIVKKRCTEDVTFTQFVDIFNEFLQEEEIPYNEKLYYTDDVLATRKNKFQESRYILWKHGEKFRYYDIDSQDYSELFEILNLHSYKNVELSTVKFMEEYPSLMSKYDIRDGYELHNLLKKVLETDTYGSFPDLKFSKMPHIKFGMPDRESDMFDIMIEHAPISYMQLCDVIHKEYGYDLRLIPNYIKHIMEYYHKGMFTIDYKEMSQGRMDSFKAILTEDFYFINDLKSIYINFFNDANADDINSYNLKRMGFIVNSDYVIQNHKSADEYIRAQLTKDDVFDITPIKQRFSKYGFYYGTYLDLRKKLDIVEFSPDRFISSRKLISVGITKEKISDFCNQVYEAADDRSFFTIESLRRNGFVSDLFDEGFENLFYSNLLLSDDRFSWQKLLGTMVFCKEKREISVKAFLEEIIKREYKIDAFDLETMLIENYGCGNIDIYALIYKTHDADIFFDNDLKRFYADQELYYREIDEAGDLY